MAGLICLLRGRRALRACGRLAARACGCRGDRVSARFVPRWPV